MRTRNRLMVPGLVMAVLLSALLACEGSSGSTQNRTQSCTTSRGAGSCSGTIGKLSGAVTLEFEDDSMVSTDVIYLAGEFSVAEGSIEVGFTTPDGEPRVVEVNPGQPAQVVGLAKGSFEGFNLTVTAPDGEAVDITYVLEYQTQ